MQGCLSRGLRLMARQQAHLLQAGMWRMPPGCICLFCVIFKVAQVWLSPLWEVGTVQGHPLQRAIIQLPPIFTAEIVPSHQGNGDWLAQRSSLVW